MGSRGGKKGGTKIPVTDYLMTMHFGVCHGPIDALNRLSIKEKPVWCGTAHTDGELLGVNRPNLFGGDKKEGGPVGVVEFYSGSDTQTMSEEIANRVELTPTTMPAYRGIANLFFRGANGKGFKWTANNPYLPGAWAHVTRSGDVLPGISPYIFQAPIDVRVQQGGPGVVIGGDWPAVPATFDATTLGEALDLGNATFDAELTGSAFETFGDKNPADVVVGLRAVPRDMNGVELAPVPGEDPWTLGVNAEGFFNARLQRTVPPGTRTIDIDGRVVSFLPLYTAVDITSRSTVLDFQSLGPKICANSTFPGAPPDLNPAVMLYECLLNTDWGRGLSPALIDTASFLSAAQTLRDERFGLSMMWSTQTDIESFAEEILDHIQAALFASPRTGLLTLKLFRADYDAATLPLLDPTNSKVTKFQRKSWTETVNEIVVTWTNPDNEKDETVTYHDLANIAIQGGIVSESRNYYGVRNALLASELGARDIRAASTPLASATVQASREFWAVTPGSELRLASPEDGVAEMVVRVGAVDRGGKGKYPLTLTVTEDIFGLESAAFTAPPPTLWTTTDTEPADITTFEIHTASRAAMSAAGVDATDDAEPRVMTMVLARKNGLDNSGFDLLGPTTLANGDLATAVRGSFSPTDYAELLAPWDQEEETVAPELFFENFVGSVGPELATLLLIGSGETGHELVMLDSLDEGLGEWTMARGMLDTVPRAWPAGTPVWFLNNSFTGIDITEMSYGELFAYKLLSRTSLGVLAEADATPTLVQTTERPYLPFRPANVVVEGTLWGFTVLDAGELATVSWSNRDRFAEDAVLSRWTEADVSPEAGQTVDVVMTDMSDNVLHEFTGLTGTTADLDLISNSPEVRFVKLKFYAARDGLRSLQAVERLVELNLLGYGHNYGQDYGENNGA